MERARLAEAGRNRGAISPEARAKDLLLYLPWASAPQRRMDGVGIFANKAATIHIIRTISLEQSD
jgi:hypothetical protein